MRAKLKLLIGSAVLSSLTVSGQAYASAQEPGTWSAQSGTSLFQSLGITTHYTQARSHIVIHMHKPLIIVENTAVPAAIIRRSEPLSASPPFADKHQVVRLGSISPLGPRVYSNRASQAGEMEPIVKTVDLNPVAQTAETMQIDAVTPMSQNKWAQVLTKYTSIDAQGLVRFDYGALRASKSDMSNLSMYIDDLANRTPSKMPKNDAMAYWANLYNALTVQVVAQNYPVKSIREIKSGRRKGPWKRKLVVVEGEDLTLDNIEHDIMRPIYKTPLVHYMVNCASIGCPNLKTSPWRAETLQADMEVAARAYINSPRGAAFENNKIKASKIYRWFKKDFGNSATGVLAHLGQYADAELQGKLKTRSKIDKYEYDWALNAP